MLFFLNFRPTRCHRSGCTATRSPPAGTGRRSCSTGREGGVMLGRGSGILCDWGVALETYGANSSPHCFVFKLAFFLGGRGMRGGGGYAMSSCGVLWFTILFCSVTGYKKTFTGYFLLLPAIRPDNRTAQYSTARGFTEIMKPNGVKIAQPVAVSVISGTRMAAFRRCLKQLRGIFSAVRRGETFWDQPECHSTQKKNTTQPRDTTI